MVFIHDDNLNEDTNSRNVHDIEQLVLIFF